MNTFKHIKDNVEKGEEASRCLEEQEFDFTEFWFDDILSDSEDLPDHLRIQDKEDGRDVHEHLHSYKDYMTDGEQGTVCMIFLNTLNQVSNNLFIRKEKQDENVDFSIHS